MSTSLKSAALLEQMKVHLAIDAGKQISSKISLVYQLNIAPKKIGVDEEIYVVDLKQGTVTEDNDFLSIATGKMNPQIAFVRGAMKIKGSISVAQKFTPDIFPKPSKL
ncbi:hypothetical protein ZIOFF_031341 [Zingiber officinale]|uniref:SCP2 domain-containing protein n=1 Tax=Zingiber officinale TaxID=94328 RepID=A0A8J5GHF3_ZINOF|nr:hypothetical protein ZIOFF_031341 [Zingiber officinale]